MNKKKSRSLHKAKRVTLKEAVVDLGIEPVVVWLNSYDDIYTLFSCQGIEDGIGKQQPYVMFLCWNLDVLDRILRRVWRSIAVVEVEIYEGQRRYILKFHNTALLDLFNKELLEP